MKHWVYFLIKNEVVVYVGCTMNLDRRINEHRLSGKSFDSISSVEFPDIQSAMAHELDCIKSLNPIYNYRGLGKVKDEYNKSSKAILNVRLSQPVAKRLRELALKEQKTISIMVENALETSYGI